MPPYIQGDFSGEVLPWSPLWSSRPTRNAASTELGRLTLKGGHQLLKQCIMHSVGERYISVAVRISICVYTIHFWEASLSMYLNHKRNVYLCAFQLHAPL